MRIEELAGKAASRQASLGGFETEDVLYLLPLVTLCNGAAAFLVAAAIGAPLFALWVIIDYRRLVRRLHAPDGDRLAVHEPPEGDLLSGMTAAARPSQTAAAHVRPAGAARSSSHRASFLYLPEFLAPAGDRASSSPPWPLSSRQ